MDNKLKVSIHASASRITSFSDCTASDLIPYMFPDTRLEGAWLLLGKAAHEGIEYMIEVESANPDDAFGYAEAWTEDQVEKVGGWDQVQDPASNRRRRDKSSYYEDLYIALTNWYVEVHPESARRNEQYDQFAWPPLAEQRVRIPMMVYHAQKMMYLPNTQSALAKAKPETVEEVVWIWNIIDSVFVRKDDGTQYIVDWKTSGSASHPKSQLHFYYYGLRLMDYDEFAVPAMPERPIGHFQYLLINDRKKGNPPKTRIVDSGTYRGDRAMFLMAERAVEKRKVDIAVGPIPEVGWQCGYCKVRPLCPVYGGMEWSKLNELSKLLVPYRKEWTGA